jgi:GntR family transcriptional regulator
MWSPDRARTAREDTVPTHTLTRYYLPEHVEGTPLVDLSPGPAGPGGGFGVLTIQGLEPDHITETFFTLMPTLEEAARLQLPAGEPVMILERGTYAKDDQLVEFARGVHAAGRFSWVYTFAVPD